MTNPAAIQDGQGDDIDPIVDADGVVYLKAAGREIVVDGAGDLSAPQLTTDSTALSGHGHQVVAAGPTRTALRPTSTLCRRITVKADTANVNPLYLGLSTVTAGTNNTTGGFVLQPGEAFTFGIDDVSSVYIHGTAGEGATFAYEL